MPSLIPDKPAPAILYLSKSDIMQVGGDEPALYLAAVNDAFALHVAGEVVQPLKPYLRWGHGHIADRIIAMPAYLGGEHPIAGLKWVGSKQDNPTTRQRERASALTILNDPETNFPVAIMEGSLISGMRTAAVTTLAARFLALPAFQRITCIGCGVIGTLQMEMLLATFPTITTVLLFDLEPSAMQRLAERLRQRFPQVTVQPTASAEEAVRQGQVIVTSTVTATPYLPFAWLSAGAFVSNISIMDVQKDVFLNADKVIVDDWEQSNREKKIINVLVEEGSFSRQQLYAELGEILTGQRPGRESPAEIILLNPMGIAIEDVACAHVIYQRALQANVGTWLPLY